MELKSNSKFAATFFIVERLKNRGEIFKKE
jgi:molybdopterin synthase catalytic subunit